MNKGKLASLPKEMETRGAPGEGPMPIAAPAQAGNVRGRIQIRDPFLEPPFDDSWSKADGGGQGKMLSDDGTFFGESLEAGEWVFAVSIWESHGQLPNNALLAAGIPQQNVPLGQQTVLVVGGETGDVDFWVGDDPGNSAHLFGFLEGANIDVSYQFSVQITIRTNDGGRVTKRTNVDDALQFDFGYVPAGSASFQLVAKKTALDAIGDPIGFGTVTLSAGEEVMLPILVPDTTRVRFQVIGDGTVARTKIHWSSQAEGGHGGMFWFPGRTEIMVPKGDYTVLALEAGFASEVKSF